MKDFYDYKEDIQEMIDSYDKDEIYQNKPMQKKKKYKIYTSDFPKENMYIPYTETVIRFDMRLKDTKCFCHSTELERYIYDLCNVNNNTVPEYLLIENIYCIPMFAENGMGLSKLYNNDERHYFAKDVLDNICLIDNITSINDVKVDKYFLNAVSIKMYDETDGKCEEVLPVDCIPIIIPELNSNISGYDDEFVAMMKQQRFHFIMSAFANGMGPIITSMFDNIKGVTSNDIQEKMEDMFNEAVLMALHITEDSMHLYRLFRK